MTATQNANAGTITEMSKVRTYEQADMYVNEKAARTYAEKEPKDIEVGDIVYANVGYSMSLPTFGIVVKRTPPLHLRHRGASDRSIRLRPLRSAGLGASRPRRHHPAQARQSLRPLQPFLE